MNATPAEEWLTSEGFDISTLNHESNRTKRWHALSKACMKGRLEVCKWLYAHSADETFSHVTSFGNTLMHWACQEGHCTICQWLYDIGASNLITKANVFWRTPMHRACEEGKILTCWWLVFHGALNHPITQHIYPKYVHRDTRLFGAMRKMMKAVATDIVELNAVFRQVVLHASSILPASQRHGSLPSIKCFLPLLPREILEHVSVFLGVEIGRRLRNAREFGEALAVLEQEETQMEMHTEMCQTQCKHRPLYTPNSPYVKYRRYLVDWLAGVGEDLRLSQVTIHLASMYMDRILLTAHELGIARHLWQLVAMICLRLAGKFEEPFNKIYGDADARLTDATGHRVEAFHAFKRHLGNAAVSIEVDEVRVREWEFFLGKTLGWNFSNITPVHCLDYYQSCQIVFQDDQQFETDHMNMTLVDKFSRHVKKYMQFFANLCLQDYYYTQVNFLFECALCANKNIYMNLTLIPRVFHPCLVLADDPRCGYCILFPTSAAAATPVAIRARLTNEDINIRHPASI